MINATISSDVRRFLKKTTILLSPLILMLPFVGYLIYTGELYLGGVETLANCHEDDESCLIGIMYTNPECPQLKIELTNRLRPEILAIGTSRIMQVRRDFFNPENSFYNAGGAIRRLPHIERFLEKLSRDYNPKLLLISLDQRFFNPNWEDTGDTKDYDTFFTMDYSKPVYVFGQIIKGFSAGLPGSNLTLDRSLTEYLNFQKKIGLAAHLKKSGFRNDGSYLYGEILYNHGKPDHYDYKFKFSHQLITNGARGFQYSEKISEKSLEQLKRLLQKAATNNIHVVAFLPPYAHEVYERMMTMDNKYGYMKNLFQTINPLFKKHNFTLIDSSDLFSLGAKDEEALDGFHGSEKSYLRLMLKLRNLDPKLRAVMKSEDFLNDKLKKTQSSLQILQD